MPAPGVERSRVPFLACAAHAEHTAAMNRRDVEALFAYTEWANDLVLAAAVEVPDADLRAPRGISHGSILGTLTHMAGAEWIWLERWHGRSPTGPEAWAQWAPERWEVAALRARWRDLAAERRDLLARLDDGTLHAPHTFRRIDGEEVTLPQIEQMMHAVNHATMHRGQVIGMLRQLGRTPPRTDLLVWYRERQSANGAVG